MSRVLEVNKARDYFSKINCFGIVSFIDYLVSELENGREITMVGMCIDPSKITDDSFSLEIALKLKQINLGRPDGKVTPLHELVILSEELEIAEILGRVKIKELEIFDMVCCEIARASTSTSNAPEGAKESRVLN